MDDIPRTKWYRFLEILPGAASWLILIGPFALAFWFPRAVAIFVMVYVLLWFFRVLKSSIFLIYSFLKSKKFQRLDWMQKMEKDDRVSQKWRKILHVVIMPTYKEEKEVLESSIEALTEVNFPRGQIIFVLATEERDRMRAETNAAYLARRFGNSFRNFHHFMHPANLPNEIPAKGANITYAARQISKILKDQGIDFSNVLVTTLDADNRPHPAYFAALTYHYLIEPNRARRSFQPLAFFYNNIWDVPFVNRVIALANTFWYLSESGEANRLFNASVYAQSLDSLVAMDYWSRHTIVEDLHQYWRAYFHFRGDYEVVPLFVPVYQDALQNKTYFTSLIGQYKQLRRWAWGASEIPYVLVKMWKERRRIPFLKTFERFFYLCFLQITWTTAAIIIFFNKLIPTVLNPRFNASLFAYNFSAVLNVVFTFMLIGILTYLWISLLTLPWPKGKKTLGKILAVVLPWILLPFVTIFYGAVPALDAQTRLMLNKPLGFSVTEKIRKIS